jgi:hypothetical protein
MRGFFFALRIRATRQHDVRVARADAEGIQGPKPSQNTASAWLSQANAACSS